MKFYFNSSIIGPDNRGSSTDSCGGIWHIGRQYERRLEGNWSDDPFDPFFTGYSGPLGFSNSLLTIVGGTSPNVWTEHTVDISTYGTATVRVVWWYLQNSGIYGDFQIDDITIDGTNYNFDTSSDGFIRNSTALPNAASLPSYPGGFAVADVASGTVSGLWIRDLGGTPTASTGSTIDHSLGTTAGYYVYAETSGATANRPFFLATPSITLSSAPGNMTFWTSRYGATIGTCNVYVFVES